MDRHLGQAELQNQNISPLTNNAMIYKHIFIVELQLMFIILTYFLL